MQANAAGVWCVVRQQKPNGKWCACGSEVCAGVKNPGRCGVVVCAKGKAQCVCVVCVCQRYRESCGKGRGRQERACVCVGKCVCVCVKKGMSQVWKCGGGGRCARARWGCAGRIHGAGGEGEGVVWWCKSNCPVAGVCSGGVAAGGRKVWGKVCAGSVVVG